MSSGGKQLIFNSLERALSTDVNRAQLFQANDRAEIYRYMLDVGMGSDDLDAGAVLTQTSTLTNPLTAEIINGFCVRPDVGDLNLAVDPGVLFAINPDSDPDSSNYKLVRDPGLTNSGVLAMTANSSGSTRIDVVECQYILNTPETDNRDIFNPATNAFAATSVSKATQAGLTYRVRAGTPGGGFPGTASGWLPLAVASVPTATTTNDTITFWDVRPILGDRVKGVSNLGVDFPQWGRAHMLLDSSLSAGKAILTGLVDVTATDLVAGPTVPGLRRLGGRLRRGTPGTDSPAGVDGLDLNDSANWSGSPTGNVYVYLLEPLGLPRWARYTDASSGTRKPRSPRGFVVVSTTTPFHYYGSPSATIALPASTGLSASTSKGICIGVGTIGGGVFTTSLIADGRTQWASGTNAAALPFASFSGTVASPNATFTFTDGTTHPANAKALWVNFGFVPSAAASWQVMLEMENNAASTIYAVPGIWQGTVATGGAFGFTARIPIAFAYPSTTSPTRKVFAALSLSAGALSSAGAQVVGWDLY